MIISSLIKQPFKNYNCFFYGLLCLIVVFLSSQFVYSANLGYAGQAPSDVPSFSAANASIYNGQHAFTIPITNIGTKSSGPQINISLSYNGNVNSLSSLQNRDFQASWVGLGFQFGLESIIADLNLTSDPADDQYYYVGPSGQIPLRKSHDYYNNKYVPANGAKWTFRKEDYGWSLIKEDGTVVYFGDNSSYTENARNATRYVLAWENTVGNGSTGGDELIASQWDIRRIQDQNNLNYIDFEYYHDTVQKVVVNPTNNNLTDNYYTRTSYPSKIKSSNGYEIVFSIGDRSDFTNFTLDREIEFFSTKKLDQILYKKSSGEILSRFEFNYSYLNESSPTTKKLLLSSIIVKDGEGSNSLPSTDFTYYVDSDDVNFGGIKEVYSPQGGVTKINYKLIEEDSTFSKLNFSDTNFTSTPFVSYSRNMISQKWSRDCYIGKYINYSPNTDVHSFEIGSWNGYWEFKDIEVTDVYDHKEFYDQDLGIAASDNWVVMHRHGNETNNDSYIVCENMGGYWKRDTIIASYNSTEAVYNPGFGPQFDIYAGKNFFVACEVVPVSVLHEISTNVFISAYYYVRTDSGWVEHEIARREDQPFLGKVLVGNDVYAIELYREFEEPTWGATKSVIYYGKYDYNTGLLNSGYDNFNNNWFPELHLSLNANSIAYISGENNINTPDNPLHIKYFNGSSWESSDFDILKHETGQESCSDRTNQITSLVPFSSGFAFAVKNCDDDAYGNDQIHDDSSWISSYLRNESGWGEYDASSGFNGDGRITLYPSGGNTLGVKQIVGGGPNINVYVLDWDGLDFNYHVIRHWANDQDVTLTVSEEFIGVYYDDEHTIWGARYLGNSQWETPSILVTNLKPKYVHNQVTHEDTYVMDGSRDVFLVSGVLSTDGITERREIYSWNNGNWEMLDITSLTPSGSFTVPLGSHPSGYTYTVQRPTVYNGRVSLFSGMVSKASFQKYDGKYTGKAIYPVIDYIDIFSYPSDPNPIRTSYSYTGGILDAGGLTPRFSRVTISSPYYMNDVPRGYTLNYFYNDIDNEGFYDPTVYSIHNKWIDLEDEQIYNIKDGGYLLDGIQYLNYSFSPNPSEFYVDDTNYSQYSIDHYRQWQGNVFEKFYIPQLISEKSVIDKVSSEKNYLYDANQRIIRTEQITLDGVRKVDSVTYVGYNLPNFKITYIDSADVHQILSREAFDFNWFSNDNELQQKVTWADNATGVRTSTSSTSYEFISADTGSLSPSLDTFKLETPNGVDSIRYFYNLELYSMQENDFVEVKIKKVGESNFSTFDIQSRPLPIDCKNKGDFAKFNKSGTFLLHPGDSILFILDNRDDSGCPPLGSFWLKGWAKAEGNFVTYLDGNEIVLYQKMLEWENDGNDEFGNVTCWRSLGFDTTCTKYNVDGNVKIASAINCTPLDFIYQDFEQGATWDDWNFGVGDNIVTSDYFTGKKSLELIDNYPNDGYKVWGPSRRIDISHFSDTLYQLSGWVKANHDAFIYVWLFENSNPTQLIYNQLYYSPSTPVIDTPWVKIDTVLSIPKIVNGISVDYVDIVLGGLDAPYDTNYIYFDDIRFHPVDAIVETATFDPVTRQKISESGNDNIPVFFEYDSFYRLTSTYDFKNRPLTEIEYYFSKGNPSNNNEYNPDDPNYTKTTTFNQNGSNVSVTFTNGVGKKLQNRTNTSFQGSSHTLVSGVTFENAAGQILESYRPYIDLDIYQDGKTGLLDYSDSTHIIAEVNAYYDGVNESNCGLFPYSAFRYTGDFDSKLIETSQPGVDFSLNSTNTISRSEYVYIENNDTLLISETIDQDGIKSAHKTDPRGKFTSSVSFYKKPDLSIDSTIVKNYNDVFNKESRTVIDTGNGEILLSRTFINETGFSSYNWGVDNELSCSINNLKGQLRFYQDKKMLDNNQFVYFKYDQLGRKIEEGLLLNGADVYFNESYANDANFPDESIGTIRYFTYKWIYDYYKINNDSAISNPGGLVRIEENGSYYKEFYRFPEEYYDITLTQLHVGSLKAVRHDYNYDGTLRLLTIYPHWPNTSDSREIHYEYDEYGRLKHLDDNNWNEDIGKKYSKG